MTFNDLIYVLGWIAFVYLSVVVAFFTIGWLLVGVAKILEKRKLRRYEKLTS